MIKISLSRDEIEEAVIAYAKDKILDTALLRENSIKISQGKSASATIFIVPNGTSEEDAKIVVSAEDKAIETAAGQPDIPVPTATVNTFG